MTPDVEVCLYRIVQEAPTNVARHSGALSCTVSLRRVEGEVELVVERERAQALAGRFTIANRPEGGARIVVALPVRAGAQVWRKAG